jgi:hypothetical protein
MKSIVHTLATALTGTVLTLAATAALADGHGRHWDHDHHRYYRAAPVYAPYYPPRPVYYAPPPAYYGPPPVVYQPGYYVPRPAPAITVGISPIVIPLR